MSKNGDDKSSGQPKGTHTSVLAKINGPSKKTKDNDKSRSNEDAKKIKE